MGQAKKRGTFEERSQQAIACRVEEIRKADEKEDRRYAERQAAEKAKWDAMTEDEQHAANTRAASNHRGALPIMGILPMLMISGIGGMGSQIPGTRRR